jgi:hypothetical protein
LPYSLSRDDDRNRIVATGDGVFRADELIQILAGIRDSGAWTYGMLFDARRMTEATSVVDLNVDVRPVIDVTTTTDDQDGARGPLAIVVTSPVLYRMACAFATLSNWDRVQVFRDRSEAESWLADSGGSPEGRVSRR